MNIAVIPARGGSRRIPGKNTRDFCGQPIIAWSIESALASGLFEHVVVSTDCPQIAEVAASYGAAVPFLRPAPLADDLTGTVPVVRHAITALAGLGVYPELVCCIYATAPLMQPTDLLAAYDLLVRDPDLEFAFAVTDYDFPILRALRVENGRTEMYWPEFEQTRSQDLPPAWHDAGQFYFGRTVAFLERDGIFSARSAPVILPRYRVQDIDTEDDWIRAEALFRAREQVT